jgi:hypothetical protein
VTLRALTFINSFLTQSIDLFYEWNNDAARLPPDGIGDGCNPPWQLFGPDITDIWGYHPYED